MIHPSEMSRLQLPLYTKMRHQILQKTFYMYILYLHQLLVFENKRVLDRQSHAYIILLAVVNYLLPIGHNN